MAYLAFKNTSPNNSSVMLRRLCTDLQYINNFSVAPVHLLLKDID